MMWFIILFIYRLARAEICGCGEGVCPRCAGNSRSYIVDRVRAFYRTRDLSCTECGREVTVVEAILAAATYDDWSDVTRYDECLHGDNRAYWWTHERCQS